MSDWYSTTVQFPSARDYHRLKVLAAVRGEPVGEVLASLVHAHFLKLQPSKVAKLKAERPDLWT